MCMRVRLCVSSPDNEGSIEACIALGYDLVGSRRGRGRETHREAQTQILGEKGKKNIQRFHSIKFFLSLS